MPDFSKRSRGEELLDSPDLPREALFQNLRELETINRKLGGHQATLTGLALLGQHKSELTIVDYGCGGGDMFVYIDAWAKRKGKKVRLIGVDANPYCIDFANNRCKNLTNAHFVCADFSAPEVLQIEQDIAISSLFCHHLFDAQLPNFFRLISQRAKIGFLVNDLHRNPIAYYSILALTQFLSKSYLVKHDAPLSVARGFSRKDLAVALREAGVEKYTIEWKWAFRWLVLCQSTSK